MMKILAFYGSPRRQGNTSRLLQSAVRGARDEGADVEEIVLRDLKMSPCLEIYGCAKTGRCAIQDDFQQVYDKILACDGIILATPVFFYAVSAHTKILMDRCQSLWVKKYWLEKESLPLNEKSRKGLLISVGATKGKKLFEGIMLTTRYFFDAIDGALWKSLLYKDLDFQDDILKYPEYLTEAYETGREFARVLESPA
ncbi:MAG TPA: flavodoxin family protein [Dissulfurispiraceae bacterium]|nr:flavodoxin family protein [Dissulfurispiraceae bacterium]